MSWLILERVTKHLTRPLLSNVSLSLAAGEIGCLVGPSGCGKTTLLRLIAGFIQLDQGTIRLNHEILSSETHHIAPHQRNIGMVFQDHALFPHLTVAQNIAFGLRRFSKAQQRKRVEELLALIELAEYAHRFPHELSGGQKQRVALARALAPRPRLMLMDEPFSSLDPLLRERLALEVRAILKKEGITALWVTHDQYEAFAVADRIGVLEQGCLSQWASAYQLYHEPQNRFIAEFIGEGAFLAGRFAENSQVITEIGPLPAHASANTLRLGCAVEVLIRPDDLVCDPASPIRARVREALFRGSMIRYTLELASGATLLMDHASHDPLAVGSEIGIRLDARHLVIFPRNST